jgi:hypothetical protein
MRIGVDCTSRAAGGESRGEIKAKGPFAFPLAELERADYEGSNLHLKAPGGNGVTGLVDQGDQQRCDCDLRITQQAVASANAVLLAPAYAPDVAGNAAEGSDEPREWIDEDVGAVAGDGARFHP